MNHDICIIGLGYVGLPLAVEFGKKYKTIGFDINNDRIQQLKNNIDTTEEVSKSDLKNSKVSFTSSKEDIKKCNTYIITVPTPIDDSKKPDLTALKNASKLVGEFIEKGDVVIYESTVYPGCTRGDCIPVIEQKSRLKLNKDFLCGYSPERVNPGDKERTLTKITKITSGSNEKAKLIIDNLYSSIIVDAETFPVESIEIAEAAKVIENTQRDLNIAFVNELAMIFVNMGLDTNKILEAAGTKWNFIPFRPGLVGGHCIGVDPYYLTYKSKSLGFSPDFILSGRDLNDNMGKYISQRIIKIMDSNSMKVDESSILILGFTFKENCPDIRNTKVIDVINEFKTHNAKIDIFDPWASKEETFNEYKINIQNKCNNKKYDVIILAVAHNDFLNFDIENISHTNSVIFDVKNVLPEYDNRKIYRL